MEKSLIILQETVYKISPESS